jgi:hypothetical protein
VHYNGVAVSLFLGHVIDDPDPGRLDRVGGFGTGIVSGDPPVDLFFFTRCGTPFTLSASSAPLGVASDPQVIQHPLFFILSLMNHTLKKKISAKNAGMTRIPAVTDTPIN